MKADPSRLWLKGIVIMTLTALVSITGVALMNPAITPYVAGESFRAELEKQTAKGLHFASSRYGGAQRHL